MFKTQHLKNKNMLGYIIHEKWFVHQIVEDPEAYNT